MSDRRCLVAVCHNGPVVFLETVKSLIELGWGTRVDVAKQAHGFSAIDFTWSSSFPRVDALRDAVADLALFTGIDRKGRKHERYSHILFLDADMTWPTDVLVKMLRHHDIGGIVSGLYCLKGGDFAPVALRDGITIDGSPMMHYFHDRGYRETGSELRRQQVVGMGCTLVPTAVFEQIGPRPWFAYEDDGQGWPRVSEDVSFCRKAEAAGFGIWLDPTVKCGHVTTHTITEKWHRACWEDHRVELTPTMQESPA